MPTFQRHPDGYIYVRTNSAHYADTFANFERDFDVELPALPDGATEQFYQSNVRHTILGPDGVMFGGDMPDAFIEGLFATADDALVAQQQRVKLQNMDPNLNDFDFGPYIANYF